MPLTLERVSKITAKGQTTVPKAVRDALGVGEGDLVAFRLDRQGGVRVTRYEGEVEESAVDAFLTFLSDDIKRRPQAVTALSAELARELRALSEGIDVDLDGDFEGTSAL